MREQRRLGLNRLSRLDPPRPAQRYEWAAAGDLLHLDIKKLGRIGRPGHCIHGDRTARMRGIGWEAVHVAIDDCTRLAYAEVLPDEQQQTTADFLTRAVHYFARRGIVVTRVMTDNGSAYRSRVFAAALTACACRHLRTRPYTPRTNGKAERFIRTVLAEWTYAQSYRTSLARTLALPRYLGYYTPPAPTWGSRARCLNESSPLCEQPLDQQQLARGLRSGLMPTLAQRAVGPPHHAPWRYDLFVPAEGRRQK